MRRFLLSLFILYHILRQDLLYYAECVRIGFKHFFTGCVNVIKAFFRSLWNGIKFITKPFRKMLYEYPVIAFVGCLFISLRFKTWLYADYVWVLFFFVLMATLAVVAIRDK